MVRLRTLGAQDGEDELALDYRNLLAVLDMTPLHYVGASHKDRRGEAQLDGAAVPSVGAWRSSAQPTWHYGALDHTAYTPAAFKSAHTGCNRRRP